MSISKAQAAALAEGFLDNLGASKSDFQPKETYTELFLLVGELIDTAQNNLNRANRIASGALSESIVADDPVKNAGVLRVDVLMNFYGAFVNKGVKGTRAGQSTAGYSFRNEVVSQSMYDAIRSWIESARSKISSVKKYKGYGKHEVKQKTIAQYDKTYAVARSIKQHGLRPTGFMDNAISKTSDKIEKRLGAALAIDIIDGLK
jgi:hypothetical protein